MKKKELERMFREALAAMKQPTKYETEIDAEKQRLDALINSKDYTNLPTEYAPDFQNVAAAQEQRKKLAGLSQTGIGAWQNNPNSLDAVKEYNLNAFTRDVQHANEGAVRSLVEKRDNLRAGLMGQAMQRNSDVLNFITSIYQQKMSQPNFWADVAKMGIGTGLKVALFRKPHENS
jgi:hypothetical protein